jgi:hypothetical protein
METHSIMLGLIYEVETSSILASSVYIQKDIDRQTYKTDSNWHSTTWASTWTYIYQFLLISILFVRNYVLLIYKINQIKRLNQV